MLIPFLFSFHPRIRFDRRLRAFANACVPVMIPFIIWDIAFTRSEVWGFNPRYLTGMNLIGLPVEEWLFFICIPYACVFTFYAFGLIKWKVNTWIWYYLFGVISGILLILAILHHARAYTFLTFLLAGITVGYLALVSRPKWLPRAVLTYVMILPFFLISNGLLTGSWIPDEVVWYNDAENLGVRIGTIPVEDAVYGFLLVLLNIILFEGQRID
jgi:lycopene cyclase domain-containing protein